MAININDPARGQRALGNAYNKLLQENAGLRINIEAQDLLVGEQTVEIVRLGTMVTDLGGDPEAGVSKPMPGKPTRHQRRAVAKATAQPAKKSKKVANGAPVVVAK